MVSSTNSFVTINLMWMLSRPAPVSTQVRDMLIEQIRERLSQIETKSPHKKQKLDDTKAKYICSPPNKSRKFFLFRATVSRLLSHLDPERKSQAPLSFLLVCQEDATDYQSTLLDYLARVVYAAHVRGIATTVFTLPKGSRSVLLRLWPVQLKQWKSLAQPPVLAMQVRLSALLIYPGLFPV